MSDIDEIQLGDRVKDKISGLIGIVTCVGDYLIVKKQAIPYRPLRRKPAFTGGPDRPIAGARQNPTR